MKLIGDIMFDNIINLDNLSMNKNRRCLTLALLIICMIQLSVSQEPTDFDYKQHGADWPECNDTSSLKYQSPVLLSRTDITSDKQSYFFSDFRPTNATAHVYKTTILITPNDKDGSFGQVHTKLISEKTLSFQAVQIRIRVHAQHKIDGEEYRDLEVQISFLHLFGKQGNDRLNVGLLFQKGAEYPNDPFLEQIVQKAEKIDDQFPMSVDLSHLLSRQQIFDFWFYAGSVTYPNPTACKDKGMNWIVPDKVFKMSQTQYNSILKLYPQGNWRMLQPTAHNKIAMAQVTSPDTGL